MVGGWEEVGQGEVAGQGQERNGRAAVQSAEQACTGKPCAATHPKQAAKQCQPRSVHVHGITAQPSCSAIHSRDRAGRRARGSCRFLTGAAAVPCLPC